MHTALSAARRVVLLTVTALATARTESAEARAELDLNGEWQVAEAQSVESPPPASTAWKPFQVPGTVRGVHGEKRWFRRSFTVPADWTGRRLLLRYDGVKYASRHFVNGQPVGEHLRGYDRFSLDITAAVRFGADNELLVGCSDWQATFAEPVDLQDVPATHAARDRPRNVGLTPTGGLFYEFGLWGDVRLLALPPVHIADVVIRTSVRQHRLEVETTVSNTTANPARLSIGGGVPDDPTVVLPATTVTVPAGASQVISWQVAWPQPRLWTFETPHLYNLRLTATPDSGPPDERHTRFGFREFWCDGPYFFLNGTRLLLRSSAMWPLAEATREQAAVRLRKLKDLNVICFRTHTQPWRQHWYEAADEVGLLMIPEGPVFNDDTFYRLDDKRFWDNYAAELRSLVARFRNHPSVVMYSLENEFFGSALNDSTPAPKAELAKLGTMMRELDPTRPLFYESDGDPDGVADVEGVHYPRELGDLYLYPNAAYWMDQPVPVGHMFLNGAEAWQWSRRKPLYIGEYLWCPCPTPALYTIFCGDTAYSDYHTYATRAIGAAWSQQTRAYRFYRVSGLCPWTCAGGSLDPALDPMAAGQAESMRPLAAFVKEYDRRFYGGQTVRRTLHVMNDTLHAGEVAVDWSLSVGGDAPPQRARLTFTMAPADLQVATFEFTMPAVTEKTDCRLDVSATLAGVPRFEETIPCQAYPRAPLAVPAGARFGVLAGPDADCARLLTAHGVPCQAVRDLQSIPADVDVLIVGRNALPRQPAVAGRPVLQADPMTNSLGPLVTFLDRGGRVLVLAQSQPHLPLGPVLFTPRRATMVFPLAPAHPILANVSSQDLQYWAPDQVVAEAQVRRVDSGLKPILVSGSSEGIEFSPLAEAEVGRGRLVVCGLSLVERLDVEPAAAVLLGNALSYLANSGPEPTPCTALAVGPELGSVLATFGLRLRQVPTVAELGEAGASGCVFLAGDPGEELLQTVFGRISADGGTLWWHRPAPRRFAAAMKANGLPFRLGPASGPVALREADPATAGLARADLYWAEAMAPGAETWSYRPPDPGIIDAAVEYDNAPPDPAQAFATLACASFEITGSEWNRPLDDGVVLASQGSAIGALDAPDAGDVILGFRARGAPAAGVWPVVRLLLNDSPVAAVTVNSQDWALYGVYTHLTQGRIRLELRFVNDANIGGEDRNVWLSHVYLQRAEARSTPTLAVHADPAALAEFRLGKGRVLVDTIRWDEPGPHAAQGRRFAKSLFLALGAQPRLADQSSVEAEALEFEKVAHNQVRDGAVTLANPGSIWVPVECRRAGAYWLTVRARGSQALEVWPILTVKLEERELGQLTVNTDAFADFGLPVTLPAGAARLELRFINDYYDPGKADRNCHVDRVSLGPAEPAAGP